ncbi:MAG: NUDIX hydrolase [Micromonosporaceae bacterium]
MSAPCLRHSARAVLLDDADSVLLCRFAPGHPIGGVWTAPGGGIEPGETPHQALRRELREEVGFTLEATAPQVWHQRVISDGHAPGYDGVVNDYFLVRTKHFPPRGDLGESALRAENIHSFRWWSREELTGYGGAELFAPRAFPALYAELLAAGPHVGAPRVIGL